MTEQSLTDGKLFTMSQVVEMLNIPKHRLVYLFDSRKLRNEDFIKLPNGERVYRQSDLVKIKQALFAMQSKG